MDGKCNLQYFLRNEIILIIGHDDVSVRLACKILECCDVWMVFLVLHRGVKNNSGLLEDIRSDKLKILLSDPTKANFDLKSDDVAYLQSSVSVIFNVGFTNYAATLPEATAGNLEATFHLIDFCHNVSNLKCLVHVSSAFLSTSSEASTCYLQDGAFHAEDLMTLSRWMTPQQFEHFGKRFKDNSFVFTKRLAEELLIEKATVLPLIIVRPTLISCCCDGLLENFEGLILVLEPAVEKSELGFQTNVVSVNHFLSVLVVASWYQITHKPPSLVTLLAVGRDVPVFYYSQKYDWADRTLDFILGFGGFWRNNPFKQDSNNENLQVLYKPLLQKKSFNFDMNGWNNIKELLSEPDMLLLDWTPKQSPTASKKACSSQFKNSLTPLTRLVMFGLLWRYFGDTPLKQLLIAQIPIVVTVYNIINWFSV